MDVSAGCVVYSKCGRDKGLAAIVLRAEGDYVYLVDGKLRRLDKPKKKKLKHVQGVKGIVKNGEFANDAEVRRLLEPYKRNE